MALRIEIIRKEYNRLWTIRIGDLTGSTESSNISYTQVLDEIADMMKEMETEQCGKEEKVKDDSSKKL